MPVVRLALFLLMLALMFGAGRVCSAGDSAAQSVTILGR